MRLPCDSAGPAGFKPCSRARAAKASASSTTTCSIMPGRICSLGGHMASQLSPAAKTAPVNESPESPPSSGWRSKPSASRNDARWEASGETVQKRKPRTFIYLFRHRRERKSSAERGPRNWKTPCPAHPERLTTQTRRSLPSLERLGVQRSLPIQTALGWRSPCLAPRVRRERPPRCESAPRTRRGPLQ